MIACLSLSANATLISDSNFVIDTDQKLDWLRWDETNNRSYNDVLVELGQGGDFDDWRYATATEAETFLANFGYDNYGLAQQPSKKSSWESLTQFMGFDYQYYGVPTHQFLYGMVDSTGQDRVSTYNHLFYVNDSDPYRHFSFAFKFTYIETLLGSFLVRDTSYQEPPSNRLVSLPASLPVQVSEPSTIVSMLLTFIGLISARRFTNS